MKKIRIIFIVLFVAGTKDITDVSNRLTSL